MKKIYILVIFAICFLAAFLRLYKLNKVPPSLNWDETAAAYNAYTIKNWGRDEYGRYFPLVFRSFADDKYPVHIYVTSIIYTFFGVSDFTTRLPSVFMGLLMVISIFLIGKYLLEDIKAGLAGALLMAVSPYAIHYSRGLWEANFAVGLFLMGLASFYFGTRKKNILLSFSYFLFGLSLISYHSSKVVLPPLVFLLTILYIKDLLKIKKFFYSGMIIFLLFIGLHLLEPRLLGLARISQTNFSKTLIESTNLYKKTGNQLLGRLEISLRYYKQYFSYNYLFINGDQLPRGSIKHVGEFLKIYLLLIPLGLFTLLFKKRFKVLLVLAVWFFMAPLPGALSSSDPNATRAIFMLGPLEILSAAGVSAVYNISKNKVYRYFLSILFLVVLSIQIFPFISYYFDKYSSNEAIQWQYGMKQAVLYAKAHPEYKKVYVTKIRNQPYIFFLFYLKYDLNNLLKSVVYDETGSKSYNTIERFGRYSFGNWDVVESEPVRENLYIVTKNEYTGFRHFNDFEIRKIIRFPGGDEAFYILSAI